jgi:hypothetical protein
VGRPISEAAVVEKIHQSSVVFFGDDTEVPEDQTKIVQLLARSRYASNAVLLTDRRALPPDLKRWMQKAYVDVRMVRPPKDLWAADHKLIKTVGKTSRQYDKVVVWTGALRLSPGHIPRNKVECGGRFIFINLESPEARWSNPQAESWVEISDGHFVYTERSPLLSLERHRAQLESASRLIDIANLEPMFSDFLEKIAKITGTRSIRLKPKVIHPFESEHLAWLASRRAGPRLKRFLLQRLLTGESVVVPSRRLVLLSTLDVGHIAEEAAHFLRVGRPVKRNSGPFTSIVEEAFAFLASRWFDQTRRPPKVRRKRVMTWDKLHQLGYNLGMRMSQTWEQSLRDRRRLKNLWQRPLPSEEKYRMMYMELLTIV